MIELIMTEEGGCLRLAVAALGQSGAKGVFVGLAEKGMTVYGEIASFSIGTIDPVGFMLRLKAGAK